MNTTKIKRFKIFLEDFYKSRRNSKAQFVQVALYAMSLVAFVIGRTQEIEANVFTVVGILGMAVFLAWLVFDVKAFARSRNKVDALNGVK